jgi:hypothetical protein
MFECLVCLTLICSQDCQVTIKHNIWFETRKINLPYQKECKELAIKAESSIDEKQKEEALDKFVEKGCHW